MIYTCVLCGQDFEHRKQNDRVIKYCSRQCYGASKKGKPAWNKGVPCRQETKEKLSAILTGKRRSIKTEFTKKGQSGEGNTRWNGGRYISSGGYAMVLHPYHPRVLATGYVPEQVLVAEKYLERFLTEAEVVHHINEIKTDNRPENLHVFPDKAAHARHHMNKLRGREGDVKSNLV